MKFIGDNRLLTAAEKEQICDRLKLNAIDKDLKKFAGLVYSGFCRPVGQRSLKEYVKRDYIRININHNLQVPGNRFKLVRPCNFKSMMTAGGYDTPFLSLDDYAALNKRLSDIESMQGLKYHQARSDIAKTRCCDDAKELFYVSSAAYEVYFLMEYATKEFEA